jgi:cell division protein FtsQ
MWDNHALLRNIANTLFALSALAILYGAIYYTVHLPNLFPIQSVRLSSAPARVVASEVLQVVRSEVRGNFFTVDIDRVRRSVERLPWVRNVSIRREFPNRLVMEVEEHQALAHWNNGALVNQQGEVFAATSEQVLPSFIGPDEASHEVTEQYGQLSQQLASLNLQATQLALSPRHAWQVRLSNEMVLELGREDMQQRLARFVTVYPYSIAAMNMKYVDLRYPNGFAVSSAVKS